MPESEETVSLVRTIKAPAQKVFAAYREAIRQGAWAEALTQLESQLAAA
jgi:uncharacterized protein YndB with AHSA1/START domain